MANYLNSERETIIRYDDELKIAYVNTFNRSLQKKIEQLLKDYPDEVKLKLDYADDDYDGIYVTMPKSWIKIRTPKKMTEEQRKSLSERATAMRFKSKVL